MDYNHSILTNNQTKQKNFFQKTNVIDLTLNISLVDPNEDPNTCSISHSTPISLSPSKLNIHQYQTCLEKQHQSHIYTFFYFIHFHTLICSYKRRLHLYWTTRYYFIIHQIYFKTSQYTEFHLVLHSYQF